jgi:hypothetical protein
MRVKINSIKAAIGLLAQSFEAIRAVQEVRAGKLATVMDTSNSSSLRAPAVFIDTSTASCDVSLVSGRKEYDFLITIFAPLQNSQSECQVITGYETAEAIFDSWNKLWTKYYADIIPGSALLQYVHDRTTSNYPLVQFELKIMGSVAGGDKNCATINAPEYDLDVIAQIGAGKRGRICRDLNDLI